MYNRKQAYTLLHSGIQALYRAEQQGMRIDVDYCEKKIKHLSRKVDRLSKKFKKTNFYKRWDHITKGKPNIDSDWQLSNYLYNHCQIDPPKRTASGKGSTDEESLDIIAATHPEVKMLVEMRKIKKIRDTYLGAFVREQVNGVLHPFFNLHTVATYRSSSDSPNFQNIPKRDQEAMNICRKAIYPRLGHQLMEVDYSSIEVKISACYHKDPNMLRYIKDPKSDMHGDMAEQLFMVDDFDKKIPEHKVLRGAAKNGFVFPQFYGDYYVNCAENIACRWFGLSKGKWKKGQGIPMPEGTISDHLISKGIKSFDQFITHIQKIEKDFWGNRFKVYNTWREKLWAKYQKTGYVDMYTGFRCSGIMRRNECINFPIQGAAFHCLLWSFIQLDKIIQEEKWKTKLVGQIHDAIVLDVHPTELEYVSKVVNRVMCKDLPKAWDWIIVPLEVEADLCDVDESWANKKPYQMKED